MSYVPDATDVTNPLDVGILASSAALEFRTIKIYMRDTLLAPITNIKAGLTTQILVGGGAGVDPAWTLATGSGAPVRATSPTLVTPLLGTPTSGVLTNCTGAPALTGTNFTGTGASYTSGQTTAALGLKSATTTVSVSAATAPSAGQVLTATNSTTATWQSVATALNSVSAASGTATIANGDNAIVWNWAGTTATKNLFTFGETSAGTNGVGAQVLVKIGTLAASTTDPLVVSAIGATVLKISRYGEVTVTAGLKAGSVGSALSFTAGVGASNLDGGPISFTSGASGGGGALSGGITFATADVGGTGTAGAITLQGGKSGNYIGGGAINIYGGDGQANATTPGAPINIEAGACYQGGTGGAVNITGGGVITSGTAGAVNINGGTGPVTAGAVNITGGSPAAGNGVAVNIAGGAGAGGTASGGDLNFNPGAAVSTGIPGEIKVNSAAGLHEVAWAQNLAASVPVTGASYTVLLANRAYRVKAVTVICSSASTVPTVDVKKETGTTAPGSGTSVLTGVITFSATANTVVSGTVTSTVATKTLAAGNRLSVTWGGTVGAITGAIVSILLVPA